MTTETNTSADTNERAQNADGSLKKRGVTDRTKRAIDTLKALRKERAAAPAKDKAPKAKAGNTFTSVDLAAEKGINAKTLRARIRRNIAKWEPLFAGEKHTFKDNATTRKAIDALLAAAE